VPTRTLPGRPNLDHLKAQAKELRRGHRGRDPSVTARILAHHPRLRTLSRDVVFDRPLTLADAQLVIAREYGFTSWLQLKHHIESIAVLARFSPHPRFAEALAAFDAGDLERLRALVAADSSLVGARTNLDPPFGYFSGAMLLHHIAGNPSRDLPLPPNVVDIARFLLNAGADVHARTLGRNGGDTMGLLTTSKQASDRGVTGPLMDLLLERGAELDVTADDALDRSLANHAPRAAEKMIALGARHDLLSAAALGRLDLLSDFFDRDGRLVSRPRRRGKQMTERDAIGLAMLFAYVGGQRKAVDFLLRKDGNWGMTGVNNGTALHRAAGDGDLDMVQQLVARGADPSIRDLIFKSTPLFWSTLGHQIAVVEWMQVHAKVDIHDAVSLGLRAHVEARLRDDPGSVDSLRDQWAIPQATPLHCAAMTNREDLARLLLEHGADPTRIAGNGMTALDVADQHVATAIVSLLEAHGGTRSAEASRAPGNRSA
jgi:hypothetical protein